MLDIMQRKRENMSPKIGSAYCLEKVPRAQGGVSQVGPISLSWDEAGSPKRIIECTDPSTREESTKHKKDLNDLKKVPLEYLAQYW